MSFSTTAVPLIIQSLPSRTWSRSHISHSKDIQLDVNATCSTSMKTYLNNNRLHDTSLNPPNCQSSHTVLSATSVRIQLIYIYSNPLRIDGGTTILMLTADTGACGILQLLINPFRLLGKLWPTYRTEKLLGNSTKVKDHSELHQTVQRTVWL
jgi:hypothetical protein